MAIDLKIESDAADQKAEPSESNSAKYLKSFLKKLLSLLCSPYVSSKKFSNGLMNSMSSPNNLI